MTEHTWIVEEIDGGHVGTADVYRCTTCGCCGGGTEGYRFKGKMFGRKPGDPPCQMIPMKRTPSPFIPGPALDVSDDCDLAQQQIRYYVKGRIDIFQLRAIHLRGEARRDPNREPVAAKDDPVEIEGFLASLMQDAWRWNPDAKNFMVFMDILQEYEKEWRRSTELFTEEDLLKIREMLIEANFNVAPQPQR